MYTNSDFAKKKVRKHNIFIIATKFKKILGINLTKKKKGLLKEILRYQKRKAKQQQ